MGGKNKKKKGAAVSEKDLMKALNEVEEIAKGNALEEADTEGGLSTEGKPLSRKAPRGKVAQKSVANDDDSSDAGSDDDDVEKAESMSEDDESAEDESDDESGDDESEEEEAPPAKKSLRARADEDEQVRKGLEISPFLEALTDQISNTIDEHGRVLLSELTDSMEKSNNSRNEFNIRMAKSLVIIGKRINTMIEKMDQVIEISKSLSNAPAGKRRSVLNKSEVVEPHRGENEGDEETPTDQLHHRHVEDWLMDQVVSKSIDQSVVIHWETSGRRFDALPLPLRKRCLSDLQKSTTH